MIKKTMTGLFLVGFVSASLLFTSCQKKVEVAPGPTQEELDEQKRLEDEAAKAEAERLAAEKEAAEAAEQERIRQEEMRAQQAAEDAMAAMSDKIFFDYDSSELKSESQEILTKKAEWLKENSDYKLKIEGNCDNRGSTEYNLALGARRAEAASKFLNALGISSDRITTISYGEEKPAVDGNNEAAWSQNRRDEFVLIQ